MNMMGAKPGQPVGAQQQMMQQQQQQQNVVAMQQHSMATMTQPRTVIPGVPGYVATQPAGPSGFGFMSQGPPGAGAGDSFSFVRDAMRDSTTK